MKPSSFYYGSAQIPEKPTYLKCGPLSLIYQNGIIRSISYGSNEIIRRVYMALRDKFWNTIPFTISDENIFHDKNLFSIRLKAKHSHNDIQFEWIGSIDGTSDGSIQFSMDGNSLSTFDRNRIGLCLLLPLSLSGKSVSVLTTSDTEINGQYPESINPHQPFKLIKGLQGNINNIVSYKIVFEGDSFEMEDQRNWTDASFKLYSTPLDLPIPVEIKKNTRIFQSVSINTKILNYKISNNPKKITISIPLKNRSLNSLPEIGLMASLQDLLNPNQLDKKKLQVLKLSHCRIDISLSSHTLSHDIQNAAHVCHNLNTSAELALHCDNMTKELINELKFELIKTNLPVTRFCIYDSYKVTSESTLKNIIPVLKEYAPRSTIATGTDNYFVEINRQHPILTIADEMCYSANPQVHTFDTNAVMENLPGIAETLFSASLIKKHTKTVITPITLRPRKNKDKPQKAGGNDLRQNGLFCAAWTLGTIFYGITGKAKSLTLYNITGENGVMSTDESFIFPAYYIFFWLSGLSKMPVTLCNSTDCSKVLAFVVEIKDSPMLLMANITDSNQTTYIFGMPEKFSVMILNEKSYLQATNPSNPWNSIKNHEHHCNNEPWEIKLLPYSIVMARL